MRPRSKRTSRPIAATDTSFATNSTYSHGNPETPGDLYQTNDGTVFLGSGDLFPFTNPIFSSNDHPGQASADEVIPDLGGYAKGLYGDLDSFAFSLDKLES